MRGAARLQNNSRHACAQEARRKRRHFVRPQFCRDARYCCTPSVRSARVFASFRLAAAFAFYRRSSCSKKNPNTRFRIVTILADGSDLYENSYYDKRWIEEKFRLHGGMNVFKCWKHVIERAYRLGKRATFASCCRNSRHFQAPIR